MEVVLKAVTPRTCSEVEIPGIEPGGASLFLILSITGLLRPSIVSLGHPSRLPIIPISKQTYVPRPALRRWLIRLLPAEGPIQSISSPDYWRHYRQKPSGDGGGTGSQSPLWRPRLLEGRYAHRSLFGGCQLQSFRFRNGIHRNIPAGALCLWLYLRVFRCLSFLDMKNPIRDNRIGLSSTSGGDLRLNLFGPAKPKELRHRLSLRVIRK